MPDISIATQRLSEILDHEQRCVDGLVALFRQEQEAIKLLAGDELAATNQRKLALLTELRQLKSGGPPWWRSSQPTGVSPQNRSPSP
jgi:hypothetical protein